MRISRYETSSYSCSIDIGLSPSVRLIEEGKALPLDPGTGKPMKDRVLVPAAQKESWIVMAELSLGEVR